MATFAVLALAGLIGIVYAARRFVIRVCLQSRSDYCRTPAVERIFMARARLREDLKALQRGDPGNEV